MEDDKLNEALAACNPEEFLQQLGESMKEIVGLGEPHIKNDEYCRIEFPVQTKYKIIGCLLCDNGY